MEPPNMKCPRHIRHIMNIYDMNIHEPAVPSLFGGSMIACKVWFYHTSTSPEEVTERVEWPLDGTLSEFWGTGWVLGKRPHLAGEIRISRKEEV